MLETTFESGLALVGWVILCGFVYFVWLHAT